MFCWFPICRDRHGVTRGQPLKVIRPEPMGNGLPFRALSDGSGREATVSPTDNIVGQLWGLSFPRSAKRDWGRDSSQPSQDGMCFC